MKPGVTAAIVIGILVLIIAIVVPIVLLTGGRKDPTIVFGVSPNAVLVSKDNAKTTMEPTKKPFDNSYINCIIYNGSLFYAVNGNSVSTSADGMTWSTPTSFADNLFMYYVGSAGPGKRLLAGGTNGPPGDSVILYSDDDGLTWTKSKLDVASRNFVNFTYAGNGTWWAFNGGILKSTDNGSTWSTITTQSLSDQRYVTKVIVHNSSVFALRSSMFSPSRIFLVDGVNLKLKYEYVNSSQETIEDMATNNAVILCITKQLRILRYDGNSWTVLPPFDVSFKVDSTFITWTGVQFIVLLKTFHWVSPTNTQVYTSRDGLEWTRGLSSDKVFLAVAEK